MQVAMKRNVIRRRLIEPKSNADNDPDPRDGGVQSVDRALSIIETLAEDDEGYRLSDLAVRTGLSTSTVHRLLATLEKRRFVQFDRYVSKWHVGAQSFAVGATFARRRNFTAQAIPYLRKLRDQTRETANLAVVDDESIIVLTRMESREIMRSLTKVGGRVAMVASGVGKAVLATYSDEDVNAIIRRQGMPRLTEKSIVRPGELFRELQAIRRRGYAVDDEEARIGLRCVAAVVYNDCGEPLAAISVSGMTSRLTDDRLPVLGTIVQEVATELTAALGGVMPEAKSRERNQQI
jgi:IclR family acetate operon transcriptional repressor